MPCVVDETAIAHRDVSVHWHAKRAIESLPAPPYLHHPQRIVSTIADDLKASSRPYQEVPYVDKLMVVLSAHTNLVDKPVL
jgi:hypothetical protein